MGDPAHDILGYVPVSESGSLGPVSNHLPTVTGAHYYPGYKQELARCRFLDASYRGGPSFKEGTDRQGQPIFVKHEKESDERYARRKRLTTYRNYVGPIVNSYANYVMTTTPVRSKSQAFVAWSTNVDRKQRSLHAFMKHVLTRAILIGRHWVGVDLPRAKDGEILTLANDTRAPYLVSVGHDNIVDFDVDGQGVPTRLVIHHEVYKKEAFDKPGVLQHEYHEWTADKLVIWRPVKSKDGTAGQGLVVNMPSNDGSYRVENQAGYKLERVATVSHGIGQVPFRCLELFQGRGIAEDIAEANKTVLNLVGLLYEELYNNTFSQVYISGISSDESDDVKFGTQTVIFLPNPEARVHSAGANPEQARSIINALFNEVKEIHRMAHMEQSGEPLQKRVAEAASKKEKDSESMDQVLEDMAEALEFFENEILKVAASFKTTHIAEGDATTKYSRIFDTKTLREKISLLVEVDKAPFLPPHVIKGLSRMILEEILEDGPEGAEAVKWLDNMTESTSPQGLATLNLKFKAGVVGPVELYTALVDPSASPEEAREALAKIKADREKFAVEQQDELTTKGKSKSGRPKGQPTPEDRRKATEKQQAANQA